MPGKNDNTNNHFVLEACIIASWTLTTTCNIRNYSKYFTFINHIILSIIILIKCALLLRPFSDEETELQGWSVYPKLNSYSALHSTTS